jgi:regulator of protease activity HflC (stomatin/prohibitin superfamily)
MREDAMVGIGIGSIVGAIALGTIAFGSWYTIDQGERGVVLRNGAVTGVADPGLHFKMPVIDDVIPITTRNRARLYENMAAYSRDLQTGTLALSVSYQMPPDKMAEIYSEFGGEDGLLSRLVDRQVNDVVRTVFGKYNAAEAIGQREKLVTELRTEIQEAVRGPIIIHGVQLENIDFSDAFENSIEQRMLAEVEVQKVRQNAERERVSAEIAVIQAQAQADAAVASAKAKAEATALQAQANADATRIQGEAEAASIAARGQALAQNAQLVPYTTASRWNGQLPMTMIPGQSTPMISLPNAAQQAAPVKVQ